MKHLKLKRLEESFDQGIISKEEYEKQKKEIEAEPEHEPEKKVEETKTDEKPATLRSDLLLMVGIGIVIVILAALFALPYLQEEPPQTLDELHEANLQGKLTADIGYVHNGVHSFVMLDNQWYTQIVSPGGTRLYNMAFRYGPRDVENIRIEGDFNVSMFDAAQEYYVTFNPEGSQFPHVATAIGDWNQHMTSVYFKNPIAACDRETNSTAACAGRPIVTCENTSTIVLNIQEAEESKISFDNNCILVQGTEFDLVKNVDKVLLYFYGIVEK